MDGARDLFPLILYKGISRRKLRKILHQLVFSKPKESLLKSIRYKTMQNRFLNKTAVYKNALQSSNSQKKRSGTSLYKEYFILNKVQNHIDSTINKKHFNLKSNENEPNKGDLRFSNSNDTPKTLNYQFINENKGNKTKSNQIREKSISTCNSNDGLISQSKPPQDFSNRKKLFQLSVNGFNNISRFKDEQICSLTGKNYAINNITMNETDKSEIRPNRNINEGESPLSESLNTSMKVNDTETISHHQLRLPVETKTPTFGYKNNITSTNPDTASASTNRVVEKFVNKKIPEVKAISEAQNTAQINQTYKLLPSRNTSDENFNFLHKTKSFPLWDSQKCIPEYYVINTFEPRKTTYKYGEEVIPKLKQICSMDSISRKFRQRRMRAKCRVDENPKLYQSVSQTRTAASSQTYKQRENKFKNALKSNKKYNAHDHLNSNNEHHYYNNTDNSNFQIQNERIGTPLQRTVLEETQAKNATVDQRYLQESTESKSEYTDVKDSRVSRHKPYSRYNKKTKSDYASYFMGMISKPLAPNKGKLKYQNRGLTPSSFARSVIAKVNAKLNESYKVQKKPTFHHLNTTPQKQECYSDQNLSSKFKGGKNESPNEKKRQYEHTTHHQQEIKHNKSQSNFNDRSIKSVDNECYDCYSYMYKGNNQKNITSRHSPKSSEDNANKKNKILKRNLDSMDVKMSDCKKMNKEKEEIESKNNNILFNTSKADEISNNTPKSEKHNNQAALLDKTIKYKNIGNHQSQRNIFQNTNKNMLSERNVKNLKPETCTALSTLYYSCRKNLNYYDNIGDPLKRWFQVICDSDQSYSDYCKLREEQTRRKCKNQFTDILPNRYFNIPNNDLVFQGYEYRK